MIDRTTVNKALTQAKAASLQLRGLLRESGPEPERETIEALMEAGAQSLWMSARASVQSEHAIVMAAQRGFAGVVSTLGRFEGPLPTQKGKSIFEVALGTSRATHNDIEAFKSTVHALLSVGYRIEDEEGMKNTALETALSWDLRDHAKVLLDVGALLPNLGVSHLSDIMRSAMKVQGAPQDLLDHASPLLRERIQQGWWQAAYGAHPQETLDEVVALGQKISPMTQDDCDNFSRQSAVVAVVAMKHGYLPPPLLPHDEYDPQSPMRPFWRLNDGWVETAIKHGAPLSALNLKQPDAFTGNDWFMHCLLENRVLEYRDYTAAPVGKLSKTLRVLKEQELWNPGHRDNEGKTAGWHMANLLSERGRDNHKLLCWQLIDEFDLFQHPVVDREGNLIPLWEDTSISNFHLEKPGEPLWLEEQKAKLKASALSRATQPAAKSAQPRRM